MGQIISVAQQKGGAGKTTVLAHLADAWARAGKRVAVLDLDPQRSLSLWAGMQEGAIHAVESAGYRVSADIRDQSEQHDYVLIDCPGTASSQLEAALRASDLVLVPCQPSIFDAWATAPILDMARAEKTPARVVLNRMPARGGSADIVRDKLRELGAGVLKSSLGNRVAFSTGIAQGTTSLGLARNSTANDEVTALRKELEKLLKSL